MVAIALVVVTVLLAAASVPLYFLTNQNWLVNGGENVAVAVLFAVAGFVIVRRQPRNPIGWILLVAPAGSQLLPPNAPNARSCRCERVKPTHIYARIGILNHALSTLPTMNASHFPSFW